jgi:hypothetical protein
MDFTFWYVVQVLRLCLDDFELATREALVEYHR